MNDINFMRNYQDVSGTFESEFIGSEQSKIEIK